MFFSQIFFSSYNPLFFKDNENRNKQDMKNGSKFKMEDEVQGRLTIKVSINYEINI